MPWVLLSREMLDADELWAAAWCGTNLNEDSERSVVGLLTVAGVGAMTSSIHKPERRSMLSAFSMDDTNG